MAKPSRDWYDAPRDESASIGPIPRHRYKHISIGRHNQPDTAEEREYDRRIDCMSEKQFFAHLLDRLDEQEKIITELREQARLQAQRIDAQDKEITELAEALAAVETYA